MRIGATGRGGAGAVGAPCGQVRSGHSVRRARESGANARRQRTARLRAETMALKDAVIVEGSMPTPHNTCPPISHST